MILRTVGHRTTAEPVALLITSEATAHGVATDVHLLAGFEVADGDGATQLKTAQVIDAIFTQVTKHFIT